MYIIDLEGRKIEITDIQASLEMVTIFLSYRDDDKSISVSRFIERRRQYWQDVYDKLQQLDQQLSTQDDEDIIE